MKSLLLIRHAKSDWSDGSLRDIDRPLNNRGKRDAPVMAGRLLQRGFIPDVIVTSPAIRAKTTAAVFSEMIFSGDGKLVIEPAIYEAPLSELVKVVSGLEDKWNSAALFGHNPGFTMLLHHFTGEMREMPTCSMALIEFNSESWKETGSNTGSLVFFDYPKSGE